jgi:hypothetical protein
MLQIRGGDIEQQFGVNDAVKVNLEFSHIQRRFNSVTHPVQIVRQVRRQFLYYRLY